MVIRRMKRDPTMEEIIKAISIYSGLSEAAAEKEIRGNIQDWVKSGGYTCPEVAVITYASLHYSIPPKFYVEISKLGRKLTEEEVEVLNLRNKGFDVRMKKRI